MIERQGSKEKLSPPKGFRQNSPQREEGMSPEQIERELNNSQKKNRKEDLGASRKIVTTKHQINLVNYERSQGEALDKIDPKGIATGSLVAGFSGYIQTAEVYSRTDLQVNYELHWSEEWRQEYLNPPVVVCQFSLQKLLLSSAKHQMAEQHECTLTASSVSNWPQLILTFNGFDFFGRKVTKGYAQMHFPISSGVNRYTANIYAPQASWYQSLQSWINGTSIEYKRDANKILVRGQGRQIGKVKSIGKVTVEFNCTLRNFQRLGFK